jgi:tRNA(fMet)-specific endonuclease VapC
MIYLLDTDIFIVLLRGTGIRNPRTKRERTVHAAAGLILGRCRERTGRGDDVGLSAISLAELEYGARRSGRYEQNLRACRQTLEPFESFAFDPVFCVQHYGIVRSELEFRGTPIGPLDTLIAAHALALDATLVSHNVKEFGRIRQIRLEDWSEK